jgi:hypothetical protein
MQFYQERDIALLFECKVEEEKNPVEMSKFERKNKNAKI